MVYTVNVGNIAPQFLFKALLSITAFASFRNIVPQDDPKYFLRWKLENSTFSPNSTRLSLLLFSKKTSETYEPLRQHYLARRLLQSGLDISNKNILGLRYFRLGVCYGITNSSSMIIPTGSSWNVYHRSHLQTHF